MKIYRVEKIELDKPKQMYNLTINSNSHTIPIEITDSQKVFSFQCDEINEAGLEKGMELLNSIDGRLDSRFAGSPFTFQNVMSSARSATASVTREYLKKWKHDEKFVCFQPMRFEVKDGAEFTGDGSTFPVLISNGIIPNQILEDEEDLKSIKNNTYKIPSGCELVNVPSLYLPLFKADLEQQIQDTLGIDTQSTSNIFKDTSRLIDNNLCPELSIDLTLNDYTNILSKLPNDILFTRDIKNRWEFKRAPKEPRYVHLDLAGDGKCDAAVCVLHKEYETNLSTGKIEIIFVVDFLLFANSKNKLDLEAIQVFCKELVSERNVYIRTISADQYQSKIMLDNFETSGFFERVKKLSADKDIEVYNNAALLMEAGRIKAGNCPKLIDELEGLVLENGKATKTTRLKDGPDALVGAVYNAHLDHYLLPKTEYYKEVNRPIVSDYEKLFDSKSQFIKRI